MTESSAAAGRPAMLWTLVTLLAVGGLLASASLNIALWKQNELVANQRKQLKAQVASTPTLRQNANALVSLIQDVAKFSGQHPDVLPILAKYGYTIAGAVKP